MGNVNSSAEHISEMTAGKYPIYQLFEMSAVEKYMECAELIGRQFGHSGRVVS